MRVLPNVVYIGPDKAGSTWLFHLLSYHDQAYVTPAKDLYFFDRFYHKGLDWYARQFEGGAPYRIVAEVSHDYLYGRRAAERLQALLPQAKLMVCLREPCERTFSAYLHLVKGGRFSGTFEAALDRHPGLIERSRYGKYVSMYLDHFPRDQIIWAAFDDLQHDSQTFADRLLAQLDLPPIRLPPTLRQNVLPAGRSRSVPLTRAVTRMADMVRGAGMPKLVGRVKASPLVRRLLYAPYREAERPQPTPQTTARLRDGFARDIATLDEVLGTAFGRRWSYG